MPVRKYRSVADMPSALFRAPLDPRNLELACELSVAATRLAPRRFLPGVHRYRSIDDAAARRETWERARQPRERISVGDIERQLRDFFAENGDVAAVYLFGSTARGTARPTSDIDVGVLYRTTPPSTLAGAPFDTEADLERLFSRRVQIIALNRAPVDLRIRVLREGRLVVDRDPSIRIRFEVGTRNEAFDLEPILQRYRAPRERRP